MEVITRYFPELTEKQLSQFRTMLEAYRYWNERINVVSRKDIDNLETHHLLHSLAIAKIIKFKAGSKLCDVGTGGGFPGIPLAILFPEVQFHLIDSVGKKIKVVNEVVEAVGLTNITAEQIRSEGLKQKFDFVLSRAVSPMPLFVSLTRHLIDLKKQKNTLPNGILYLKGGNISEELMPFRKYSSIYNLSDYFEEEFFETKKVVYLPF